MSNTRDVRVVVTGLGTVNPLGGDVESTWSAMLTGTSGVRRLEQDWAAELSTQIAAPAAIDPLTKLERVKARRMDRNAQFAVVAAQEAWADAGYDASNAPDPERLAVSIGSGIGGLVTTLTNYDNLKVSPRRVSPLSIPMLMPNSGAAYVGLGIDARAAVHTPVSACASGNEAIALALDLIRLGRADVVVAGGTDACIHPLPLAAFGQMQALSRRNDDPERASRPWDAGRDGFVLGEGAGVLVLESEEHAKARGATVYAYLEGAGVSNDSHDIAQPQPEGRGAAAAMRKALQAAGLTGSDIKHINAHATSTPQGDVAEGQAIHAALGDAAAREAIVTGTKSMTGHLLGAAGALESVATIKALTERVSPPTINLQDQDPAVDLDIATTARELPSGQIAALNNSFGFGGANVALVFASA